jgi:hypothetical protein
MVEGCNLTSSLVVVYVVFELYLSFLLGMFLLLPQHFSCV